MLTKFFSNKQMKVIDYKTGLGNNNSINSQHGYNIPQYNSNKNSFNQPQGLNNMNKILPSNNFAKPSVFLLFIFCFIVLEKLNIKKFLQNRIIL